MIVYLFSAWAIKAVGKTASKIIQEVRRQFKADPEILNPKDPANPHQPDYAKCVDITTRAGLREMMLGLLHSRPIVKLWVSASFPPNVMQRWS
jgi:K(+)-stimulated pyrophosphate-energized sodium pump